MSFENFTAISIENERLAIGAFRESVGALLSGYPTTVEEDESMLKSLSFRPSPLQHGDNSDSDDNDEEDSGGGSGDDSGRLGYIATAAVQLRLREKCVILCFCAHCIVIHRPPPPRYNASNANHTRPLPIAPLPKVPSSRHAHEPGRVRQRGGG